MTKTRSNSHLLFVGCAMLPMATSFTAHAQSADAGFELEEITITATKFETNLQKTALSVTAIMGDDMVKEGKKNLQEALEDVPNLSMQGGLSQGSFFIIRGVGNNPVFGQDASVTFTTNGVFNQRGNSIRGSFYDVNRLEVSRGPQNTLTGRSAEGGSINLIPNEPVLGKTEISGSLEAGSHQLVAGQGAMNLPLSDVLAFRGAFTVVKRNGFNTDGTYDEDTVAGRVRLLYQPSDDLKIILTDAYTGIGGKGDSQANTGLIDNSQSLSFPNGYYWNFNPPDTTQDYRVNDFYADITWKTAWTTIYFQPTWQYNKLYINGWSEDYANYVNSVNAGFTSPVAYTRNISLQRNNSYQTQRSGELRFSSPDGSDIKWMAGAYYYRNYQPINVSVGMGSSAQPLCSPQPTCTQSTANSTQVGVMPDLREPGIYPDSNRRLEVSKDVYAQITIPFTSTWRGTAGARYSSITKSRNLGLGYNLEPDGIVINSLGNAVPFDNGVAGTTTGGAATGSRQIPNNSFVFNTAAANVKYNRTNWKVVLEHDLNADQMIYGMVSTGWKSGSFINLPSSTDVCVNDGALGNCKTTTPAGTTYLAPGFTNSYKPEYLTAYEIGSKNEFLDHRMRVNASAFYYDYKGYQFNVNLPIWNPATGADPDAVSGVTLNAKKAESYGAEIESSFVVTPSDKVGLNASYLHAVFKKVELPAAPSAAAASTNAYISATQWANALTGFSLPHSPKMTLSPSYAHIFTLSNRGTLNASVDGNYQSSYVLNLPGNATISAASGFTSGDALIQRPWLYTQKAFWKYNLSLSYSPADANWSITGYSHNVSNKAILTQISVPTAVTGSGTAGLQNIGFTADEPRTFGVIFNVKL